MGTYLSVAGRYQVFFPGLTQPGSLVLYKSRSVIRNGVRVQYKVLSVLLALSAGSVCVELPIISIVLLLTGANSAHEAKDGLVQISVAQKSRGICPPMGGFRI